MTAMTTKRAAAVVAFLLMANIAGAGAETSPYAGQEQRGVKALSDKDMSDLLAGRGAGYALAAELNGYPGPLHVLDLGVQLGLTKAQRAGAEAVFAAMNSEARSIGAEIVTAERALDRAFAAAHLDKAELARRSEDLGRLYGRYRAAHLKAHIDMKALLSPHQTTLYASLRGYKSATDPSSHHPRQH